VDEGYDYGCVHSLSKEDSIKIVTAHDNFEYLAYNKYADNRIAWYYLEFADKDENDPYLGSFFIDVYGILPNENYVEI